MKNIVLILLFATAFMSACTQDQGLVEQIPPSLLSNPNHTASCVFLTEDETGHPFVSWVEVDSSEHKSFYFAKWDEESKEFGEARAIPIAQNTSVHEEGMPKIAFKKDGTILAIYETSVPSENSRFGLSDIKYTVSNDLGLNWSDAKSIQTDAEQDISRSFSNMIRLEDGEIGIAWLDTDPDNPESGRPVKFAKTMKNNDFDSAILIEDNACQCCRTALSKNDSGEVNIVFRDLLSGSIRDISMSSSKDNGKTFAMARPFSDDNWVIDACPHNGPSVVSSQNRTFVTWFTGSSQNGIFYGELDENQQMIKKQQLDADGRFAQITLLPNGERIAVFNKVVRDNQNIKSKIMVNRITDDGFFEYEINHSPTSASYPVSIASKQDELIVAWSDNGEVYYRNLETKRIDKAIEFPPNYQLLEKKNKAPKTLSYTTDPVCGMKVRLCGRSCSETGHPPCR